MSWAGESAAVKIPVVHGDSNDGDSEGRHPGGVAGLPESPDNGDWESIPNPQVSDHTTPMFPPSIAFLGLVLCIVFFINYFYKNRSKPRRKKPRLKRIPNIYGVKMPGV